ncbi:Homoserine kinase [Methanosarcinaceae archaeon Ag5]|uniref:Shikimate kinase n=1 Tax=Methanolapillus africanus TaxID=3028297 RepID=A0AAE4SD80_9EURY|nr:Homoserine kinase [Methanosarcinaceae archaeon Ag5]
MIQKGYGCAFGGGTIINAIAAWKGGAFATEMKTYAQVILEPDNAGPGSGNGTVSGVRSDSKSGAGIPSVSGLNLNDISMNPYLTERCVEIVFEKFDVSKSARVMTKSDIPAAGGLKSSSAAANSCVLAALDALGYLNEIGAEKSVDPLEVVKWGVAAAKDAKVTITGAFDDACASFFGGVALTDNKKMELIKNEPFDYDVLIFNPNQKAHSADTNVARSVLLKDLVEMAFDLAKDGQYEKAMKLNGLLYCGALAFSPEPALSCMELGQEFGIVSGLSGTGPSFIALFPKGKTETDVQKLNQIKNDVRSKWISLYLDCRIFDTKTCNRDAVSESLSFSEKMKVEQKDLTDLV